MAKFKFTQKQFEAASAPKVQADGGEEESEEKKKLKDTISEIESDYQNSPNRTYDGVAVPNTQEKTYQKPTEEQTYAKASEELSPLYNAKMQSLNSSNAVAKQNVEEEKDELYERAEKSLNELKKTYSNAKENTSNEALKRGLARSSIILNQLNDLEQSHVGATGGLLAQRDKDLSALSKKLDELELKFVNDKNVLNEEKEREIMQRVEELFEKYKQEEKEVADYNKEVREKKEQALAKLEEQGISTDETQSEEYAKMIAGKTRAFYSYYYSLGKQALYEMEKDRQYIIDNIGEKGYEALMRYFV